MTLSADQMSLCFQSYWYMWLTNGLSGLLFIGIDIGIAAFFLKKFGKQKADNYHRPASSTATKRPFSPANINSVDDADASAPLGKPGARGLSAKTDNSDSGEDENDFAYSALQATNAFRQKYNARPVQLSDQLTVIAQRVADQMARTGKLEHSPAEWRNYGRQTLGENYFASFQTELKGDKMVRKWMKEGRKYQFGANGNKTTENFTQLVWQATREIGVARARSTDGNWWYGVVIFDPPGNIPNQYANNVLFPSE